MKTWRITFEDADKNNFDQIKRNSKKYETRAATIAYASVKKDDSILFVCGNEQVTKLVTNKYHFSSIDEMVQKIPLQEINPEIDTVDELKHMYSTYKDYDTKIDKFGIFAFELA